ncbi:MAG: HEPN domain-containing protein [Candidatus Binatia bacterium]
MNKAVVFDEWRRAAESLGAAESCRRDGYYADSISRTYYVILHAAKAALQLRDVTSESHAAVKRLFGLHLVQTGLVEGEWAAYIGIGLDVRLTADYDAETRFSDTDARDECDRARSFLQRIRQLLLTNGFTADELRIDISAK